MNAFGRGSRFALLMASLVLVSPVRADDEDAAPRQGAKKPRIIQVDVDRLPPELVKQLLIALSQADSAQGKDHSRDWHRPYDFTQMPPGVADKMFASLPPGIAKKVRVGTGEGPPRYDWNRLPPGIADHVFARLPPGIAKKVLPPESRDGKGRADKKKKSGKDQDDD